MKATERSLHPDLQADPDFRQLAIEQVGVRDLRAPIVVLSASGERIHSIARWTMSVGLPGDVKGAPLPRFVELLDQTREAMDQEAFLQLLMAMLDRLDAQSGRISASFPYFVRKTAPVSAVDSLLDYEVTWRAGKSAGQRPQQHLVVHVPVTGLSPLAKEVSAYGAHNQRSTVTIGAALRAPMAVETLIRVAEEEASSELFGLLKRPGEKYVAERAYDNPKSVEDLVRDIALRLMQDERIARWQVVAANVESIHNHSAYAALSGRNG